MGGDYTIDSETSCWYWRWATIKGYPVTHRNGHMVHVNRLVYTQITGTQLGESDILYRNKDCPRSCINPTHMKHKNVAIW